LTDREFGDLLAFRVQLRRFNRWSQEQAKAVGLTHAQHQLLLAVHGHCAYTGTDQPPTVGDLAAHLLVRHHSAVELVDRAEAAGFVRRQRDTRDARRARVTLTARGAEQIAELTELHLGELRQLAPLLDQLVADST
jgi:DNA-binding MarR family transcriptional regulator